MVFKAGYSGNPSGRRRGTPNRRTELAKLLEPHAEGLVAKTIELALEGDVNALRLCIERLIPKMQREPTGIEWPRKLDEKTIPKLEGEILQAALDGRITFEDAERLKKLIPSKPSDSTTLRITTTDPNEAARIYQQFMRDS